MIVWEGISKLDQIPYYHYESSQFISHLVKRGNLMSKVDLPKLLEH